MNFRATMLPTADGRLRSDLSVRVEVVVI